MSGCAGFRIRLLSLGQTTEGTRIASCFRAFSQFLARSTVEAGSQSSAFQSSGKSGTNALEKTSSGTFKVTRKKFATGNKPDAWTRASSTAVEAWQQVY